MSLLSKLFGGGSGGAGGGGPRNDPAPETHGDFRIYADPAKEPGGWRIQGRIEKDYPDGTKAHDLIRADVIGDRDQAVEATLLKCRQIIDQQGDRLFN